MSEHAANETFPRGPLLAIGFFLALTLIAIAASRLSGVAPTAPTLGPVVEARDLKIVERANGGFGVYDAAANSLIEELPPRVHGFVGVVHRGLVYERNAKQADVAAPVRLNRHEDGTLSLNDPATGRLMILTAFGGENAASFRRMLASSEGTR